MLTGIDAKTKAAAATALVSGFFSFMGIPFLNTVGPYRRSRKFATGIL
jgi:hypothetical protein